MDVRALIKAVEGKGIMLRIEDDRIKVEARTEPDSETKALLELLRDQRDELRRVLTSPTCWNCGAAMTGTKDIYGAPWWVCWKCARWA